MKKYIFPIIVCMFVVFSSYAQVSEEKGKGVINGHEYVDLGLSVKWRGLYKSCLFVLYKAYYRGT